MPRLVLCRLLIARIKVKEFKKTLEKNKKVTFRVRVSPGSRQSKISHEMADGSFKVFLSSPPEKGKANLELVKLLSREFGVDKENVQIISGRGSRVKLVAINNNYQAKFIT